MGDQMGPSMHMNGPMWTPVDPPTLARIAGWHPQPIPVFLIACALALLGYGWGVWRLRRRGDRWPAGRVIAWVAGLVTVVAMTGTGVGGYGMALFSVHMVQHMVLGMLSPILLLLGAPVTLALRALPATARGRYGARRVLLAVLHSRPAQALTFPVVTLAIFLFSLYGIYFTPLFDLLMRTWWAHNLMLAHFVAAGLLFFWPILGIDPAPRRTPHLLRLLELFVAMPFHAFFGIAVMMATDPVVTFFAHLPAGWQLDPMHDQNVGGGIAWAFSELPTLLVAGAVFVQWVRSDARAARRRDRAADRDGDAELAAYNAYLADLAAHGPRRPGPDLPAPHLPGPAPAPEPSASRDGRW